MHRNVKIPTWLLVLDMGSPPELPSDENPESPATGPDQPPPRRAQRGRPRRFDAESRRSAGAAGYQRRRQIDHAGDAGRRHAAILGAHPAGRSRSGRISRIDARAGRLAAGTGAGVAGADRGRASARARPAARPARRRLARGWRGPGRAPATGPPATAPGRRLVARPAATPGPGLRPAAPAGIAGAGRAGQWPGPGANDGAARADTRARRRRP